MLWVGGTRRREMLEKIALSDVMLYDSCTYGVHQVGAEGAASADAGAIVRDPEELRAPSSLRECDQV